MHGIRACKTNPDPYCKSSGKVLSWSQSPSAPFASRLPRRLEITMPAFTHHIFVAEMFARPATSGAAATRREPGTAEAFKKE